MSRLDKKIISLILVLTMLFSCFFSLAVYATDEEEYIDITDEALKESLKYSDFNGDGKYSKAELENISALTILGELSDVGYSELKNLPNLQELVFSYISSGKTIDLTNFNKLIYVAVKEIDEEENLPTIKVPENIFLFKTEPSTSYYKKEIDSFELKDETIYEGQAIFLYSTLGENSRPIFETEFNNSGVELEKGDNYNKSYSLRAKAPGTTEVTFRSDLSERTITVNVKEKENDTNPAEKTNCEDAKIYYNAVLTASGDLYRANLSNPKAQMQKVDTNVSKYVYPTRNLNMYLKGNTATILYYENEDITKPVTENVENVKDISYGWNFGTYLTTDGTLYKVDYNITKTEVSTVDTNVTKTEGNFYVKDGKTYEIESKQLISEQAFDKAYGYYYLIGNTLSCWESNINKSREIKNNISKVGYEDFQLPYVFTLTDGSFYSLNDSIPSEGKVNSWNGLISISNYTTHNAYTLNNKYELYFDDINLVFTNVIDAVRFPEGLLILRRDGSVWYQDNPFKTATCVLENTKTTSSGGNTEVIDPGDSNEDNPPEQSQLPIPEIPNYSAEQIADLVFEATYYANKYPDLKATFGNDEAALRNHWLTCGIKEGRQASPVFNPVYYLNNNSDLKDYDYKGAYEHFISIGWKEYRNSSEQYWGYYYRVNNSDLINMNPYELMLHYLRFGMNEGRKANNNSTGVITFTVLDSNALFNAKLYADLYPDLKVAFGYDEEALKNHWAYYGMKEGRIASLTFDARYYLNKYEDLKNAFGDNYSAAFEHFQSNGIKEGRQASELFDVKYYVENNSDLKNAFGDNYILAINHFASNGITEGRDASAEFKLSVYKEQPDLAKAFGNNNIEYYKHYITFGKAEGRKAN